MLIVDDARHIVGTAVVLFRRGSRVARLYSIAIADAARGRGLGRVLLAAAERAASNRDCEVLRLEVRADNHAAQQLYEGCGYCCFGLRRGYYEDGDDALRYEKPLA